MYESNPAKTGLDHLLLPRPLFWRQSGMELLSTVAWKVLFKGWDFRQSGAACHEIKVTEQAESKKRNKR
jgi:hypothetical protein